ncbi:MAG: DNA repair protein RecO [Patescibacteria group bacterium]|nr:DNA repair protein RecO [Patescibacteria group bacterium]
MYLRDQVIILKKIPYREHDRQYVMYGRIHGLLLAAARGTMKPRAKQAGQLEPFSIADVMIAKGRNFDQIAVAVKSHGTKLQSVKTLGSLAIAGAFADLCLRLIRPGVADERLFKLWEELIGCLASLPEEPSALRAKLLFGAASLKLMDTLGYGPALSVCGVCRRPPGPTDAWFSPNLNGLICVDCVKTLSEPVMPARAHSVAFLRFMRASTLDDVLRVGLAVDVAHNALRLIQEVWKQAPLDREPHGMDTIERIMAV